jgi:prepilin-type N-terminal cleavage/methylation domain-containing protein
MCGCDTRHDRRTAAFTLVELLIVIGIIALVMAVIVATFAKVYKVIESWK